MDKSHDLSLLLRFGQQGMDVLSIRQRKAKVLPLRNEEVDDGRVALTFYIHSSNWVRLLCIDTSVSHAFILRPKRLLRRESRFAASESILF